MNRSTIRDVARVAGVALGTASRVINGQSKVSPNTRKKVEEAIAKLGYAPDQLAQSMRRGSTHTVGIMVRDITVPSFASFVRSAQETLQQAGYALLITCSENQRHRELDILRLLDRRRVDGIIMNTAAEGDPVLAAARGAMGVPIVMLERQTVEPLDSILLAHYDGMCQALDYLFGLGHQRIGLVTGSIDVYPGRERVRGYEDSYEAQRISVDPALVRAKDFSGETSFRETMEMLEMELRPTAVIAGGIAMLADAIRAIRACGLRVPDDVSLIGNADSELAQLSIPPITVVRWNYARLGEIAASLLLDHFAGRAGSEPRHILEPSELVVRGSCAAPSL